MDVFFFVAQLIFVQAVISLEVTVYGQTYIESGVPYIVSCTVNEYRDLRDTVFRAVLSDTTQKEVTIRFFNSYGCYHVTGSVNTLCNNASCSCNDNGLTTHWTFQQPLDLTTQVTFTCYSTDNDKTVVPSNTIQATIPYGPGSSLKFNTTNESVTKVLGEEFFVICSASCEPKCEFRWKKNTSAVSSGATLHIPKLAKDDYGNYTCTAENGHGTGGSKTLYLMVNYGPESVTLLPPDTRYTVTEGQTIPTINCTADCKPLCNYIWSGPRVPVDSTNLLSFQNIQKNQRGVYGCTASNDVGSLNSSDVNIDVQFGPGLSVQFEPSATSVTKHVGDKLGPINCSATCNPPCQYTWTKPDKTTINTAQLVISSLSVADHGLFVCTASNGINGSQNKSLNAAVNYGPQSVTLSPPDKQYTVTEGNTIPPINCMADCRPACTYLWSGPNVPADSTNVLSLQNIQKNQRGVFSCTASNDVGSLKSSNVNIDVQFGPGSSVQFEPSVTSVTKIVGNKLGPINCSATCNPPCQYTWTQPDKSTINGGQLVISSLSVQDHGPFICTASNGINGSQNKSLIVAVHYGPLSVTLLPPDTKYTVTEGNNIPPINCMADCRPACTYLWSGANVPAGTTNVLSLQNIQKNQRGVFSCTASNDVGSLKSSDVNIDVQFGPGLSMQFEPSATSVTKHKGDKLGPISCSATCNPPCQYTWTKPDKTTINTAQLVVSSLTVRDHGLLICTASNGINGSQNKSLNVTVNYGPVAVILSPKTKQYTITFEENNPPITCTADCRPVCNLTWSGPGVPFGTINVLSLQNIQKNQSGNFICTASNEVDHIQSSIDVNVQYKPDVNEVTINGSNFTLRENATATLSCIVQGNPVPKNTWERNSISLNEAVESNGRSFYTIQPAQCKDSGNYSCVSNNSLGLSSAQRSLFVTCSPRLNSELEQPSSKIGLPKGGDLNLTVHLIAYPTLISTEWSLRNDERNETNISSYLYTYELFKHVTILSRTNMTQFEFGDYILKVQNIEGTEIQTYHVVPQGPPDPTTLLNVTCGVTTALLYWKTSFNGGEKQNFSIIVHQNNKEKYVHATNIDDDEGDKIKFVTIELSAGEYVFTIYGKNSYGNKTSLNELGCQVKDNNKSGSSLPVGAAAGGGTAAAMFIVLIVVLFVFIKKRRSVKGDDGRRNLTTEDKEDDEGLKDNPLYASSGEASVDSSPLYSVVNKTIKQDVVKNEGPVYSHITKTDTKGKLTTNTKKNKKTGKPGNAGKDMEMGSVYENSKNLIRTEENDEVYSNTAYKDNIFCPTKNKDGLIYADLDLAPSAGGKKFVIRGLENRNNYAIIDLTKTAEPLPSDEDDDVENTSDEKMQDKSKDIK